MEQWLPLVKHIYNKKYKHKFPQLKDDLIQEGCLGIPLGFEAYERHNHKYSLMTYMYKNIHLKMYDFLQKEFAHEENQGSSLDELDENDDPIIQITYDTSDHDYTIEDYFDLYNAYNNIHNTYKNNGEKYKRTLHNYALGNPYVKNEKTHQNEVHMFKQALKQLKENYNNGIR